MKNKTFYLTLLLLTSLVFTSCARKGYGCPMNASAQHPTIEKNRV